MANILTFPISLVLNGQAGTDFGVAVDLDGSEVTGTLPTSKGGTGNTSGTATTNANLTGHVTSVGNAAVLGSFTIAQLSAALSDANISGDNTGDQTNISGNAATVTTNANLTGHVTSTGNAAVLGSFTLAQLNTAVSDADVASLAGTETLTNKRVTPRILSAASYTTDTGTSLNIDNLDEFIVTAQAGALLFNNPTGTPTDGQKLIIAVTGTAARALTYDTQFEASTVALPTTTVTTARLNMGFIWRADTSKWVCVAVA